MAIRTPKRLTEREAADLTPEAARTAALQYSQLFTASTVIIDKLEKKVAELTRELGDQNQQVLFTNEMLANMRRKMFGASSERRAGDGPLFCPVVDPSDPVGCDADQEKKGKKKREGYGRTAQPRLPLVTIYHEIPEEEVAQRGLVKWDGQFEESELISIQPTRFVLEQHKRQKYLNPAAQSGDEPDAASIVTAPGPMKLCEGGRYSIDFGVEVGIAKYLYHMPLDRQTRQMAEHGLDIESQTLYGQTRMISQLLKENVIPGIVAKIHATRVNQADETWWRNLSKNSPDKKRKFYFWGVRNEKAVCFNVYDSRSHAIAREFLGKLKGVVISDGYGAYKQLGSEDLQLANDWYHVRRKFIEAEKNFSTESKFFIESIKALSLIERHIQGRTLDEIRLARNSMSRPIVEEIKKRIALLLNFLPQSSLGRAVQYTWKLWDGLTVYLDDPEVPFGTNEMESAIRGTAVGRKNHYGSKNLASAEVGVVWYSVIETCKANGVDPRMYITAVIRAIRSGNPVVMPWGFKKSSEAPMSQ